MNTDLIKHMRIDNTLLNYSIPNTFVNLILENMDRHDINCYLSRRAAVIDLLKTEQVSSKFTLRVKQVAELLFGLWDHGWRFSRLTVEQALELGDVFQAGGWNYASFADGLRLSEEEDLKRSTALDSFLGAQKNNSPEINKWLRSPAKEKAKRYFQETLVTNETFLNFWKFTRITPTEFLDFCNMLGLIVHARKIRVSPESD